MSYFTVKYVRDRLADLPGDEPLFGALNLRQDQEVEYYDEDGYAHARVPTPDEWAKIVDLAEEMADRAGDYGPWAALWDCLNDAKCEVVSGRRWVVN